MFLLLKSKRTLSTAEIWPYYLANPILSTQIRKIWKSYQDSYLTLARYSLERKRTRSNQGMWTYRRVPEAHFQFRDHGSHLICLTFHWNYDDQRSPWDRSDCPIQIGRQLRKFIARTFEYCFTDNCSGVGDASHYRLHAKELNIQIGRLIKSRRSTKMIICNRTRIRYPDFIPLFDQ